MLSSYYEQDGITIYHGDAKDVLPTLGMFDAMITDPPYGVDLEYASQCDDSFEAWKDLMRWLIPQAMEQVTGCIAIPTSKIEGERFLYQCFPPLWRLCWFKGASDTRCTIGWKDWEPVFLYGRPHKPTHDHFKANAVQGWLRERHPCPKPIEWASWLISRCVGEGKRIVDPFCGSGTTLVAARMNGNPAVGIEMSEEYCELAVERLRQRSLFAG